MRNMRREMLIALQVPAAAVIGRELSLRLHSRRHNPRPPVGREDNDASNAFWWPAVRRLMARRCSHTCAMRELSLGQPCDADSRARRRNDAASAFDVRVDRERDRKATQQQRLSPTLTFAHAFYAQALLEGLTTYADNRCNCCLQCLFISFRRRVLPAPPSIILVTLIMFPPKPPL